MLTIIVLSFLTITAAALSIQFICYLQYKKASPITYEQPAAKEYSPMYA